MNFFTGFSQQTYPQLHEICTDQSNIMSYEQLLDLREKLTDFETETSHQIAVLTIANLGNESIENYALQVFEQNRIGQADVDNGLLILFSAEDREVRIEVGYGLEPIITDGISSRLIRNIMIPEFKEHRYFEGIDLATDEIIKIIRDSRYAEEFAYTEETSNGTSFWGKFFFVLFIGAFFSVFFYIGIRILKNGYKDLVNLYRGLFSGEISVLSFPFRLLGVCFPIVFGMVFTFAPLFSFCLMLSQFVFDADINTLMNGIIDSEFFNVINFLILVGIFLLSLPVIIAALIVKRYDKGFKLSFLESNMSYIKKNMSFNSSNFSSGSSRSRSSSSSRSSGYSSSSSSSSRSSFSGGGGRSGGGGASGRW